MTVDNENKRARHFLIQPEKYERNYQEGQHLRVGPATHRTYSTETPEVPGVAIFTGPRIRMLLTAEHAYDLANMIADVLEATEENS